MRMLLAVAVLALAVPVHATTLRGDPGVLQMYCSDCNPGPAEQPKDTPAGITLCRDCSNQDEPCDLTHNCPTPVITCPTCFRTPGQPFACHGCDIHAAP